MLNDMKIRFVANKKKFALVAAIVLLIGLVCNLVLGTRMDIQFTGGTIIKYSYTGDVDKSVLQEVLAPVTDGKEDYTFAYDVITNGTDSNPNNVSVSLPATVSLTADDLNQVLADLQKKLPDANFRQLESNSVEATMGREFFGKCIVAIVLASVLMLVYVAIRFRKIGGWSAGLMSLLALVHDVAIAYFVFVIFRIQLDDNFVAVVLAILGYSLNNTIVIYDRIRENRRRMGAKASLAEVVDRSINQSFRRSLFTTITTFVAVASITVVALVYSLDSILSFSVPMMFGLVAGFYSSTFLAAPLWVALQDWRAKRRAAKAEKNLAK